MPAMATGKEVPAVNEELAQGRSAQTLLAGGLWAKSHGDGSGISKAMASNPVKDDEKIFLLWVTFVWQ